MMGTVCSHPRNPVILTAIAALGIGLAVFLFVETASTERSLSEAAFRGAFTSVMASFQVYMSGQLRAIRAVADSLATHGTMPDFAIFSRIAREYEALFVGKFNGIGVTKRLENNSTAFAAFEQEVELQLNRSHVRVFSEAPFADENDEFVWAIQDMAPITPPNDVFIGYRLSSNQYIEPLVRHLKNYTDYHPPSPTVAQPMAISGIFAFHELDGQLGMIAFSSVFDDDPMAYCVGAITTFDSVINNVATLSAFASVEIRDHLGGVLRGGGCTLSESEQVLTQAIPLLPGVTWSISIGQCPAYKEAYVSWRRWVLLFLSLLMTCLSLSTAVFVMKFQDNLVQQALEKVRHLEKDRAHQLVVGYICHELRNPLHIVKTSFQAVSSVARFKSTAAATNVFAHTIGPNVRAVGPVSAVAEAKEASSVGLSPRMDDSDTASDIPSEDEIKSIIADATAALAQMQSTVNEVLDYRAIESGVSTIALKKEPIVVSNLVMPIAMRCRAFLPVGVGLQVVIAEPNAIAFVDKGRISQIITNGLSNAGKFTTPEHDVRITVALVRRSQVTASTSIVSRQSRKLRLCGRASAPGSPPVHRPSSDVYIAVGDIDPTADDLYLSVTVSNPRSGPPISNTEDCFVPFKNKTSSTKDNVWKPVKAPPEHVSSMFGMWECAMEKCRRVPCVTLPELRSHRSGAVKVTTGLGLPLSRGFAHASAGWLALDEGRGDGMTHLWCVVEATAPHSAARSVPLVPIAEQPSARVDKVTSESASDPTVVISVNQQESVELARQNSDRRESPLRITNISSPPASLLNSEPFAAPVLISATASSPSAMHQLRVVFVDDDPPNRRVGARFLKSLGVPPGNVIMLADGVDALAFLQGTYAPAESDGKIRSRASSPAPTADVMFLDIRMPGKSGIEVMQEIGRSPPFPIIAMTGNVDKDSVEEYRALGFAGCIGKPFTKASLKRAIELSISTPHNKTWFCFVGDDGDD